MAVVYSTNVVLNRVYVAMDEEKFSTNGILNVIVVTALYSYVRVFSSRLV